MPYNSLRMPSVNLEATIPDVANVTIKDPSAESRDRFYKRMDQDRRQKDQAIESMIKDPKNAEYYSRAYGVQITPEIGALLREPLKAQKLLEAAKVADSMGIANYQAKKAFTQKYLETGDMMQAAAAIEGMDVRKQLDPYQEQMLDLRRQSNETAASRTASINAARAAKAGGAPAAPGGAPTSLDNVTPPMLTLPGGAQVQAPIPPSPPPPPSMPAGLDAATPPQVDGPQFGPPIPMKQAPADPLSQSRLGIMAEPRMVPDLPAPPPKERRFKVEYQGKPLVVNESDLQEALSAGAKRID